MNKTEIKETKSSPRGSEENASANHDGKTSDKRTNERKSEEAPKESASVAYISETLIKQITKEDKLDLIVSLAIHFPKDKLNKKIKFIENLEKLKCLRTLDLSDNMIEKMQKLETLAELRELNLSRNCVKAIECVDNLPKLEVLDLSGNQITSIPRQTMKKLRCLKVLKLSHNKLDSLLEVTKLRPLQDLTNLDLEGNPFSGLQHYRQFVIYQLRSLHILDNQTISKEERRQADMRFAQEEVQRLEAELVKQEKLYQALQDEKNKANETIEQLMKMQNSLKEKDKRQGERMKELERDIEAKNKLVKAKNADLVKASEKQYRLEQELGFYKLDAKFELLSQMPLLDNHQIDEEDGVDDSAYIGKATFKRNQFARASNISGGPQQNAEMKTLRRNYEEMEKLEADLDRILNEKKEALRQLQRELDEKNDELRDVSEKLASLELSLAGQLATVGQGNALARKQLAEKINFIKRLQAAAEELEARLKIVASDVAEKQRELEELGREKDRVQNDGEDSSQLDEALRLKEAELRDANEKLSELKEKLDMVNQRILKEEAEVERLRRELGEDSQISPEAFEHVKKELEGVIHALNKRLEELQNLAKEQQARIRDLEHEGEDLRTEIAESKDAQERLEDVEQKLEYALVALKNEERKCLEGEGREQELQDTLSAFEKNNKLGLMEVDGKLKHAKKEIARLQDNINKLKAQLKDEREAAKARVDRDQERIAKALEAAKGIGDKDEEIKELALQVNALKATNEALKDRLNEARQELNRRAKETVDKDKLHKRVKDLLRDLEQKRFEVRQPFDETDEVGECLAGVHRKYLDLQNDLENERENGKRQQKQAKIVVDELRNELSRAQSQLQAAESALAQLTDDAARKENELNDLEDEIERLRNRLQEPSKNYQDDVDIVRDLAKRQKNRFEKEVQELQAELQELQDKHFDELGKKDEEIAELEALLSENAQNAKGDQERNKLQRDLDGLKRQLSDRLKANEGAIEQEKRTQRARQKLDESRRRIEDDLKNAENKIQSVENLLRTKQRQNTVHDRNIDALAYEVDHLKRKMSERDRGLLKSRNSDDVTPVHQVHHIYTPRDLTYHHYHDTIPPAAQLKRDPQIAHDVPKVPAFAAMNEVHYHHHGNNAPMTNPDVDVSAAVPPEVARHRHYDNPVAQTPLSAATTVNQVHRHYHHGNGDFTRQLKRSKTRKKDYCNISEHEDLEDDVVVLEEKLASTQSKLSSQITENKLNTLRSDLQNLEHTVSDSVRSRTPSKHVECHLDESLAKLQDHMLTLMDHRANLLSQQTGPADRAHCS